MAHYLTFASKEAFTLGTFNATKNWDGTLYYSTDTATWNEWSGIATLQSAEHEGEHRLYLRGSNNTIITGNSSDFRWVLTGTDIRCIGNIECLLDYTSVITGLHPPMGTYCFSRLFYECTVLTEAPELPATALSEYCYHYMFYNCSGITKAPDLPATTIVKYCYYRIFSGTSITKAPEVHIDNTAYACCSGMFANTLLAEPIPLPATTLTGFCYNNMYSGCVNMQISAERTDYYSREFRIPTVGDAASTPLFALTNMFTGTGGTFTGAPARNTTYYYHPAVVTITFLDWDGTVISQEDYEPGAPIVIPPNPTRASEGDTNYAFRGWSAEIPATADVSGSYTATYEATTLPVHTIRFLDWDDSVIDAPQLIQGEVISLPATPIRPDDEDYRYTFDRWEPIVPATATASGDYKAVYTSVPCYRVDFVDWDGSIITSSRYLNGDVVAVPENPVRESDGAYTYEFDKWTPDVYGVAIAHATYTATYKATLIPVFYDVIFQDWDGTIISNTNYAAGDIITIPPNPTKESDGVYTFAFSGWEPAVSIIARANVTYVAQYIATEIPVYYNIVFLDWDGGIVSQTATLKNTNIVIPPDPSREDSDGYWYKFTGWTPTVPAKATADGTYTATYDQFKIYNSLDAIFESTSEFTVIRDNSKNDDGTDTVTGVDWFTYNGTKCTSIYVSGNSWIGLGTNSEDLKVNRQDSASWYVYREEGMLYRYYKFLRIRFSGYSNYSVTDSTYQIIYDVLLWDTGDISLHMVKVPTNSYTGTFTLGSTSYTKPTALYPNVTFKLQEDGTYKSSRTLIDLKLPFSKRFLVKIYDDISYKLYTVVDGALSELTTRAVTGNTFREFGCEEIPSGDLLLGYTNFELLRWYDSSEFTPEAKVTVTALPWPQTVESKDYDMTHGTIHGVEKVNVDATETVSFALSTNSGETWMAFKDGVWVALTENESGMSAETIRLITTEQWNSVMTTGKFRFRMTLVDEASVFTSLVVDYLNEAGETAT